MHFDICSKKSTNWSHLLFAKSAFNLHCAIAKILVFHKQQKPWKIVFREDENCFFWWDAPLRRCCFNSLMIWKDDLENWNSLMLLEWGKLKSRRILPVGQILLFQYSKRWQNQGRCGGKKAASQKSTAMWPEHHRARQGGQWLHVLYTPYWCSKEELCTLLWAPVAKASPYWGQGFGFRVWLARWLVRGLGASCRHQVHCILNDAPKE